MFKTLVPGKKKRPLINTKCLEERNKCRFFNYGNIYIYVSIFYVDHTCFPQFYHFFFFFKSINVKQFFPSPFAYILALLTETWKSDIFRLYSDAVFIWNRSKPLHTSNDGFESPFENNDTVWCRPAKSNCPEYLKLWKNIIKQLELRQTDGRRPWKKTVHYDLETGNSTVNSFLLNIFFFF